MAGSGVCITGALAARSDYRSSHIRARRFAKQAQSRRRLCIFERRLPCPIHSGRLSHFAFVQSFGTVGRSSATRSRSVVSAQEEKRVRDRIAHARSHWIKERRGRGNRFLVRRSQFICFAEAGAAISEQSIERF